MAGKFTVRGFFKQFPDDDACLHHIMETRYGSCHTCAVCGVESTFHRITKRKAYACAACGAHLYPCAGTIFQDSRTPLQLWFYAILLFVTARHGISGKELERQLGVTYKTAWRMGRQIRQLMEQAKITFRSNHRPMRNATFGLLIEAVLQRPSPIAQRRFDRPIRPRPLLGQ